MLSSDLHDFSDAYIVVKGTITVSNPDHAKRNKNVAFKNEYYLSAASEKLMVCKFTMQKA